MERLKFDIVFHLAGEQVIPNYMAMKLSEAPKHVLLTTARTAYVYTRLANFFKNRNIELRHIEVPATDYCEIKRLFELAIAECSGRRVGVNITGGTKPMAAAALDVSRENDLCPFYMDTQERKIHLFTPPFERFDMPPVFSSVKEYVKLAGYAYHGPSADRLKFNADKVSLLSFMWKRRRLMHDMLHDFTSANTENALKRVVNKIKLKFGGSWPELDKVFNGSGVKWQTIAHLCGGVWFEEWLTQRFQASSGNEAFLDLQSGFTVSKIDAENGTQLQEIDMAFTDGYKLYLFECKGGKLDQSFVQKLDDVRRSLGGSMGVGVLCSLTPPNPSFSQRISLSSIACVSVGALPELPGRIFNIKRGKCYTKPADYLNA